jgi:putative ABC transport system permease protein
MFRNYCKTAFRNLVRNKRFGLINISGLAIGITSSILIFVVVHYELSYDTFEPGNQHIYEAAMEDVYPDGTFYTPGTPYPMLEVMKTRFPQMVTGVLYSAGGSQLTVVAADGTPSKEKRFIEDNGVFFADADLFKVFKTGWLSGSPQVLDQPNKIVLSKKMAEKYFGQWTEAVGKYIRMDNLNTLQVAGIIQDPPGNSDFQFRAITSYPVFKSNTYYPYTRDWGNTNSNEQLYVLLGDGQSLSAVNASLEKFSLDKFSGHGPKGSKRTVFLRPLSLLHFDTRMENMGDHVTNKSTLWTLSLIAGFILLMACINFVNLSTVQAVNRSKEIGVRKVLGSSRWNLLWQILGETSFIVGASILLAVGLTQICLPYIRHIASINETISLFNWQTGIYLLSVFVTITLLAGLYPAYVASGFSPTLALKNKINSASVGGISVRRTLVVIQFAISQVLIVGTLIAVSQMNYVQNADLGLRKEGILVIRGNGDSVQISRMKEFKEELLRNKSVEEISQCSDVPSSDNNSSGDFSFDHKPPANFNLYYKFGDADYCKTFGLQLVAGRLPEQTDTIKDLLINETLASKLGLKSPEEALGKDLQFGGDWRKVVGVVKDFRTNSLRESTKPLMIACDKNQYTYTALKLKSSNLGAIRDDVQQVWDKFFPEYASQTYFMDEKIEAFYTQEHQLALLYKIFAGIAVFISCLGLYGLVSFMAVQKKKEVGIRKVLGASITQIIYLFSKEFTVLILIAFAVAVPVSWFMMNDWLQHFVYRIPIRPLLFAASIGISVFIAWLTVGYKSFQAARMNPARSLKSE